MPQEPGAVTALLDSSTEHMTETQSEAYRPEGPGNQGRIENRAPTLRTREDPANIVSIAAPFGVSPQGQLGLALSLLEAPSQMPMALPASHLTDALSFQGLVDKFQLEPRFCPVFKDFLTYLFYGGLFYRKYFSPTNRAADLPVAFLFNPAVSSLAERYYPSDTGALEKMEADEGLDEVKGFRTRFCALGGDPATLCKMVHYIFETNDRYLFGEPRAECRNLPDPLPDLFKLFSRDLSERGIDQRFRRFELHFRRPISLKDLIWVAYPEGSDREFAMLYEKIKPQMPQYYRYKWYKNFRPAELAAELQSKAREMAIDRYMKLPG